MFRLTQDGMAELLSVDETMASEEQLARYAFKGLLTAQKISNDLLRAARTAWLKQPDEVAAFIKALLANATSELAPAPVCARTSFLAEVREKVPFDSATLRALDTKQQTILEGLGIELHLAMPHGEVHGRLKPTQTLEILANSGH